MPMTNLVARVRVDADHLREQILGVCAREVLQVVAATIRSTHLHHGLSPDVTDCLSGGGRVAVETRCRQLESMDPQDLVARCPWCDCDAVCDAVCPLRGVRQALTHGATPPDPTAGQPRFRRAGPSLSRTVLLTADGTDTNLSWTGLAFVVAADGTDGQAHEVAVLLAEDIDVEAGFVAAQAALQAQMQALQVWPG